MGTPSMSSPPESEDPYCKDTDEGRSPQTSPKPLNPKASKAPKKTLKIAQKKSLEVPKSLYRKPSEP